MFLSIWRRCYFRGKIGAWFALDVALAQKSFWMHSMVSLGDGAQVEARFGPFVDSANFEARWVHGLRRTYHRVKIVSDAPDGTPR
jgi:hypothetical protein